jgi:predicted Zn-dependent protease
VTLGIAWVATSFALLSNLVLPLPMWLAERTLYLPSVGVALAVAGAISALSERVTTRALRTTLVAVCALGALHSALRSRVWRDDEARFSDLIRRHPESFRGQWWLGGRLVEAGDLEGGLVWLAGAVERSPNSALLVLDYARALLLAGRSEEAEPLLRPVPPAVHPSRSVFLAQSLIFQGRDGEAEAVVREGLRFFPSDARLLEQARQLGLGEQPGG